MKWVIGALIMAVVWSVATGRVTGTWLIYAFSIFFSSVAAAQVFAFWRSKHYGFLVLGFTYFAAAVAALVLLAWWPLFVGFALVWLLRLAGFEPKAEEVPDVPTQAADADGEKKA